MTTTKPLNHMTPLQRIAAKQKVVRLNNINKDYQSNPGCGIKDAVKFTKPNGESASLVQQYSKLLTELGEITAEDIDEYVYGPNPSRHMQMGR